MTCDTWHLKRKAERCANTTYFVCRKVGHSAKDCPSILAQLDTHGAGDGAPNAKNLTGICYRCASNCDRILDTDTCVAPGANLESTISRGFTSRRSQTALCLCVVLCVLRTVPSREMCPKNNGKGVYPNEGSCKLCGETTHLAKDCALCKKMVSLISPPLAACCFFFSRGKRF